MMILNKGRNQNYKKNWNPLFNVGDLVGMVRYSTHLLTRLISYVSELQV